MKTIFSKQDKIDGILEEVKNIAGILWERGWSEKNAGNISVLLPDRIQLSELSGSDEYKLKNSFPALKQQCFYMTATGKRMQDVAKSPTRNGLFVQLNKSGDGYLIVRQTSNTIQPTSEFLSHLGIHNMIAERRTGETVVMHTHATEIIALTQYSKIKNSEDLNRILLGMHPETMVFIPKGVGLVPYILPGTQAIADATINSFKDHDIVVWKKHGIFAIGKSLTDTFDHIDIVCKAARIWFQCKSAGFEPEGLKDDQLNELKKLAQKFNS
jgi:rhamnulose-1-phosphate aldolase